MLRARFCARHWRYSGGKTHVALALKEFTVWFRGREDNKHVIIQVINYKCVHCYGGEMQGAVRVSCVLLLHLLSGEKAAIATLWHDSLSSRNGNTIHFDTSTRKAGRSMLGLRWRWRTMIRMARRICVAWIFTIPRLTFCPNPDCYAN